MRRAFVGVLAVLSWIWAVSLTTSGCVMSAFVFMWLGVYCTKLFLED